MAAGAAGMNDPWQFNSLQAQEVASAFAGDRARIGP